MSYPRRKPPSLHGLMRTLFDALERFPESKPSNIPGRYTAWQKRRARNKRARANRRKNALVRRLG